MGEVLTTAAEIIRVEYVESDNGYGFWTRGWVASSPHFTVAARAAAARELSLGDIDLPPDPWPVTRGYARERTRDEYWVSFSERPNGGSRATYAWFPL
jgi:hypothetical protein